jgi:ribosomal protein S18 acetylase RimI-like enzyme
MQALNGHALWFDGQAIGYSYFVFEEHKGLLGDLYILRDFDSAYHENQLLSAALSAIMASPFLHRVESQLMMLRWPFRNDLPHSEFLTTYARNFMMLGLAGAGDLRPVRVHSGILIEPWRESSQEDAARLISRSYQGHVDSDINDQYRSFAGARRFLTNIVQYPGCGTFYPLASYIATEESSGRVVGVCLASLVAEDVGHITQVCIAPELRGTGLGYELIRRSAVSLQERGCTRASLTVTASNENAVRLYERMGFHTQQQFAAYVWDGF